MHELSADDVFSLIKAAGQQPHYAYALGNDRLSCVFCIMTNKRDLTNDAANPPALLAEYAAMESRTDYTMNMSRIPLVELIA
uniref:hypothetical protein n=1 Tax=Pseudomonas laurentiana TaxID=2364649 RepID=UPI0029C99977|nr:hypothetical protein [Pseudomonas laurentiana]